MPWEDNQEFHVQKLHLLKELPDILLCQTINCYIFLWSLPDCLIFNIGEIHASLNCVPWILKVSREDIFEQKCPEIADMSPLVNRRPQVNMVATPFLTGWNVSSSFLMYKKPYQTECLSEVLTKKFTLCISAFVQPHAIRSVSITSEMSTTPSPFISEQEPEDQFLMLSLTQVSHRWCQQLRHYLDHPEDFRVGHMHLHLVFIFCDHINHNSTIRIVYSTSTINNVSGIC